MKKAVVTGGSGFIGSYLAKRLLHDGFDVTVVDNLARGTTSRLCDVEDNIELLICDIRDKDALVKTFTGAEVVFHLAAINGTENFYKCPDLILDVGIKGMFSVVEACQDAGVYDLVVASSAEVYHQPQTVPTPEDAPLVIPDSFNPRYSYAGSKLVSELISFNCGRDFFNKVQVFRPHNVYGPDMGFKHVIPQFFVRAIKKIDKNKRNRSIPFEIEGSGTETRAFCYIDDIVDGIMTMYNKGKTREIYHIGNDEEVSISDLARAVANTLRIEFDIGHTEGLPGGTSRRCPDISKMSKLGYRPEVSLREGLKMTALWYQKNYETADNSLM